MPKTSRYRRDPRAGMLYSARARAGLKRIPFSLKIEDIVIPEFCPILGIRLERGAGSHGAKDTSPTLDRIIPKRGYVKGNVHVISRRANMIKSCGTLTEHLAIAYWLARNSNLRIRSKLNPVKS